MLRIIISALLASFIMASSGALAGTETEKQLTSNHKQLTSVACMKGYADWSPDGKRIVYSSHKSGSPEIWVMDIDLEEVAKKID